MSERSEWILQFHAVQNRACVCVCLSVCLCTQYRPNEATDHIQIFWGYGYWPKLDVISFWAKSLQPFKKKKKMLKNLALLSVLSILSYRSHSIFLWAYILIYHRLLEFLNKIGAAVFPKKDTFWKSPKHGFLDAQYFTYKLLFTAIWKFIGSRAHGILDWYYQSR